ncbi:MAG: penicillin-binding protein 2 [Gammaproteobacteria bacterium]|nr:penicillin-binding protein 2 [Gammaproteobacteria bacterium]
MAFKSPNTQEAEKEVFLSRMLFCSIAILVLATIIITRLFFLMVIESDQYKLRSLNNTIRTQSLPASRGLIYDRNKNVLASNQPIFQLEMIPEQVLDISGSLEQLADLNLINKSNIETIKQRINRNLQFKSVVLRRSLSETEVAVFANNRINFKGIDIKSRLSRHYPQGEIFSHALGYVGSISSGDYSRFDPSFYTGKEQIGKTSIERNYEPYLRGKPGTQKLLVNVRGRIMESIDQNPFLPGNNLVLTIDSALQETAFKAMGKQKGAVVILDATNGEILVMLSTPSFDPNKLSIGLTQKEFNTLSKNKNKPLFNRAIAGQYPPGSTIKPMIALGALEMGIIDPDVYMPCEGRFFLPNYSRPFNDWSVHGAVNVVRAIQASCDVYFYEIATEMGIDKMSHFLKQFNLGAPTQVDIGSEKNGVMPNKEWKRNNFTSRENQSWYEGETVIAGIGQGYMLATPLQLALATAIIANKGKAHKPHILKAIEFTNSGEIQLLESESINYFNSIDDKNWDLIHEGMKAVVNERRGTAYGIFPDNSPIAGKTGSSQVFSIDKRSDDEVPEELRDHGLFIGFAPIDKPEIIVSIIVENGGGGRIAAAPVAEKIFTSYLEGTKINNAN